MGYCILKLKNLASSCVSRVGSQNGPAGISEKFTKTFEVN